MNCNPRKALVFVLASLFALAPVVEVAQADRDDDHKGVLRRLVANFRGFEGIGSELATILPPSGTPPGNGGQVIYEKSIYVDDDMNVLFVTVSGTANVHDGARLLMTCLIDDIACNPGALPGFSSLPGWVPLQRYENYNLYYAPISPSVLFRGDGQGSAGDLHMNSLNYTWCTPIKKKKGHSSTHTIKIKIASFNVNGVGLPLVDLEGTHFFIDGAKLRKKNACKVDDTPVPPAF